MPLDIPLTVGTNEPFAGALLRVWTPGPGELVVGASRQLAARALNRTIHSITGFFTALVPPGWTIPVNQMTPWLLLIEGKGRRIYFLAHGAPVLSHALMGGERVKVEFGSKSIIFEMPGNLNPDEVMGHEMELVRESSVIPLLVYHDWLWERAKGWNRLVLVKRALKHLAGQGIKG